jgi:hypothetical protein
MARSSSCRCRAHSCSSEATGRAAGMAGLLYSAALQADLAGACLRLHRPDPRSEAAGWATDGPVSRAGAAPDGRGSAAAVDRHGGLVVMSRRRAPPILQAYPTGSGLCATVRVWSRTNARSAVDAIVAGAAFRRRSRSRAPSGSKCYRPLQGRWPACSGRIALRYQPAQRLGAQTWPRHLYDYTVEWAPGVDPSDGEWKRLIGRA